MTPELAAVIARVQEQLGEQIELLDREGGEYAKFCVMATMQPRRRSLPPGPVGMHPGVRRMIRQVVSDEMFMRRRENARSAL